MEAINTRFDRIQSTSEEVMDFFRNGIPVAVVQKAMEDRMDKLNFRRRQSGGGGGGASRPATIDEIRQVFRQALPFNNAAREANRESVQRQQRRQQQDNNNNKNNNNNSSSSSSSNSNNNDNSLEPVTQWIVGKRVCYVPEGHKLVNVALVDATRWWANGQFVRRDSSGRQHVIRPFKDLEVLDWTDKAAKTKFGVWVRVFHRLEPLLGLCKVGKFSDILDVVDGCVRHFRDKYRSRGYQQEQNVRAQNPRAPHRVKVLEKTMPTVYKWLAAAK